MAGSVASEQPGLAARQWWRWPVGTLAVAAGLAAATVGVLLVVPAPSPEPARKALPGPVPRDAHPDLRRDREVTPNLPNDVLIFERVGHSPAALAPTGTAALARR